MTSTLGISRVLPLDEHRDQVRDRRQERRPGDDQAVILPLGPRAAVRADDHQRVARQVRDLLAGRWLVPVPAGLAPPPPLPPRDAVLVGPGTRPVMQADPAHENSTGLPVASRAVMTFSTARRASSEGFSMP